jgi:hypothetical protein
VGGGELQGFSSTYWHSWMFAQVLTAFCSFIYLFTYFMYVIMRSVSQITLSGASQTWVNYPKLGKSGFSLGNNTPRNTH